MGVIEISNTAFFVVVLAMIGAVSHFYRGNKQKAVATESSNYVSVCL